MPIATKHLTSCRIAVGIGCLPMELVLVGKDSDSNDDGVLGGFWEDFGKISGGFGKDFGRVLGRFWMDFGKILFLSPASHLERHV